MNNSFRKYLFFDKRLKVQDCPHRNFRVEGNFDSQVIFGMKYPITNLIIRSCALLMAAKTDFMIGRVNLFTFNFCVSFE